MRSKLTNRQFDAEIVNLPRLMDRAREVALRDVDRIRRARGAAASREVARVRAQDGAEADGTVAMADVMLEGARTLTQLRHETALLAFGGRIVPQRTIAVGKVMSTKGVRFADLVVVLTTDGGKLVGEARVDAQGAFLVEGSRDEFVRLVDGARAIVASVRDAAGGERVRVSVGVRTNSPLVFVIDLDGAAASTDPEPQPDPPRKSLSDIRGLATERIALLAQIGITDVRALAAADAGIVARALRVSAAQAADFIAQARQLMN